MKSMQTDMQVAGLDKACSGVQLLELSEFPMDKTNLLCCEATEPSRASYVVNQQLPGLIDQIEHLTSFKTYCPLYTSLSRSFTRAFRMRHVGEVRNQENTQPHQS
jgi:hypothetical protein